MTMTTTMTDTTPCTIEHTRKVLGACTLLAIGMLLIWVVMYLVAADFIFAIHSSMFGIDRAAFDLAVYCGIGLFKIAVWVFFLIPYLALKITGK